MAEAAGQTDRARKGMARADKLTPALSKLTIDVAPETAALVGLEVKRGQQVVASALFGSPVPVDPGAQIVVVTAPGYETLELKTDVAAGGQLQTLQVPALAKLPEAPVVAEEPQQPAEPAESATPADASPSAGKTQRTVGLVSGGVGVVGLGVGGVFGVLAMSKNKDADCSDNICATKEGQTAADDAKQLAGISNIAFIAGGVFLATGAVLYFTAPRSSQVAQLQLTPTYRGAALSFGGNF
jgi:serine/threonine-protein kinase